MTNFRPFETEEVCRQTTISNLMKMEESSSNKWKTLYEKKKCYEQFLVFHSVFKRIVLKVHKNQGWFGKGLKMAPDLGTKEKALPQ